MFTGIVQNTAAITAISPRSPGAVLKVANPFGQCPQPGESISVDGVCLTVVSANEREISFDLSEETLKKTVFSSARPGRKVNLERALKVGDSISGHFVTGHIDGVAQVLSLRRQGAFAELLIKVQDNIAPWLVPKGSVAVNGVSLTVASLERSAFTVVVIPETLARTNLGALRAGDAV
ncbi:MAG: riboflavin synthase, partial [Planctomycetes bacterium]|nr:riboflavin synthase [Planctomycetota bacterium]